MTEPLRVLHVVTHMNRGGLETMLMNYYRNIDRTRVQFDFLEHRRGEHDYSQEIRKLGGRIYQVPVLNPFSPSYFKALDDFFLQHPEYSIIHSHLDCMSAYPLRVAKRHQIPVRIAHSHNTNQEMDPKYLIKLFSKGRIPQYATHLFACGEKAGKWMFSGKPFFTLNNAVDAQKYQFNPEVRKAMRRRLHLEDKFVLGHIGRFNKQKNHQYLIDIFHAFHQVCPKSVLLLVGQGDLEPQIKEKVFSTPDLADAVLFMGIREDIPEILQAMDVFVFPSLYEGLPVTLIEAQASGLPCVVSDAISEEAAITDLVHPVSLKAGERAWLNEIQSSQSIIRADTHQKMIDAGFDVWRNAKYLEQFYLEQE